LFTETSQSPLQPLKAKHVTSEPRRSSKIRYPWIESLTFFTSSDLIYGLIAGVASSTGAFGLPGAVFNFNPCAKASVIVEAWSSRTESDKRTTH